MVLALSKIPNLSLMMSRVGLILVVLIAMVLALSFPEVCFAQEEGGQQLCSPSSCGNIRNISHPFRLKDDPPNCGDPNFELACENNRTTLYLYAGKYFVTNIFYSNQTLRVVDASLNEDSCSIPRYTLASENFSYLDPYRLYAYGYSNILFINCILPAVNSSRHVDISSCINNDVVSASPESKFYALYGRIMAQDLPDLCRIEAMAPILSSYITGLPDKITNLSVVELHRMLLMGFEVSWFELNKAPTSLERFCEVLKNIGSGIIRSPEIAWYLLTKVPFVTFTVLGFFVGRAALGILCFIAFLIYKYRRRHLSVDDAIEKFLQSHNNFMPIRYSYSEIKEMTKGFKDKLGQGGFGSVYKGKLRSGHLIAVKVLSMSKANGQDFISEVATIGRIHHVNVVRLAGFCVEGSKRALIFDFMANGSLDKFIFSKGEGEMINTMNWGRTHEIGVGVARGIEYLHRGCDMQILHFDIKPHNILLDENFIPKVSDFGLAKLYPIDDSIVSLTAARGTLGYIAPELFYKNIGGVSYKADVYSFGMLLMEMVGKRKNRQKATAEYSSRMYFPSWVYDRINQGEEIELGITNEDEQKFAKKMIIVALWCTQLNPVDRPSMSQVLEMLESGVELLTMPPKPLLYHQEMSIENHANNPRGPQVSSYNGMDTITLDGR